MVWNRFLTCLLFCVLQLFVTCIQWEPSSSFQETLLLDLSPKNGGHHLQRLCSLCMCEHFCPCQSCFHHNKSWHKKVFTYFINRYPSWFLFSFFLTCYLWTFYIYGETLTHRLKAMYRKRGPKKQQQRQHNKWMAGEKISAAQYAGLDSVRISLI